MHPRQWNVRRRVSTGSGEKQKGDGPDSRPDSLMRASTGSSSSDPRSSRSSSDYRSPHRNSADSRSTTASSRSSDSHPFDPCRPASITEALESSASIVHRNSSGAIIAGTLHGLVRELAAQAASSSTLPQIDDFRAFFFIYTDFTSPERIVISVERHFHDADALPAPERLDQQHNAFRLILRWVQDPQIAPAGIALDRMAALAKRTLAIPGSANMRDQINKALNVIEQRRASLTRTQDVAVDTSSTGPGRPSTSKSQQSAGTSIKPLRASEVTPRELAIALTLLEGDRYRALKPSEYIQYLRQRPGSTASSTASVIEADRKKRGVQALSILNNDIIHWVKFSLLDPDDEEARASAMLFFINTAQECRRLRNFSSTTAIANALQSAPVERLQYTRQRLPANALRTLEGLISLLDPSSNHRAYRAALRESHDQPTLPWLAVHLRDLNASLERFPPAISAPTDGHALLNFDRIARAAARMADLLPEPSAFPDRRLQDSPHAAAIAYLKRELRHSARGRSNEELIERAAVLSESEELAHRARKRELEGLGFRVR